MHRPSVIPRGLTDGRKMQPEKDGLKIEKDSHKPRNMRDFPEMGRERKPYPSETSGF